MFKCQICKNEIRFGQNMVVISFGKNGKMIESEVVRFHHRCLKKKEKGRRKDVKA